MLFLVCLKLRFNCDGETVPNTDCAIEKEIHDKCDYRNRREHEMYNK